MEYTIISHNNEKKEFEVESNNIRLTLDYPGDITSFDELSSTDLDIIVSGFSEAFVKNVEVVEIISTQPILSPKIGSYLE
jgi:hypothetical protein